LLRKCFSSVLLHTFNTVKVGLFRLVKNDDGHSILMILVISSFVMFIDGQTINFAQQFLCTVPDVIQLLSDHIANQIAAGEVIQRPSSAVKELLENAVDAGATEIQLVVKDAGKELLQVIDNGCGMSPTDARMSFERHATSKIRDINDLFSIRTMGFRGEALASIAAVAQVELKSMKKGAEVGSRIVVEGTEVKLQEPCATPPGT